MSTDMYEWESDVDKFEVKVLACIYVLSIDADGAPQTTCGFLESDDHELYLPALSITRNRNAAHAAVELFKQNISVDLRTIDIVPSGFFDPIYPKLRLEDDRLQRTIYLGYKTRIHPGTPVHQDLRFKTNEEIQFARARITRGHYEAYRAGLN